MKLTEEEKRLCQVALLDRYNVLRDRKENTKNNSGCNTGYIAKLNEEMTIIGNLHERFFA